MKQERFLQEIGFPQKRYFARIIKTLVDIIDSKDMFTRGHSEKVMRYCAKMAKVLTLNKKESMNIKIAALLHDIGKFRIDKTTLSKQGKLTKEEWREVEKHSQVGAEIVEAAGLLAEIIAIILYHHARFGGGGYPDPNKKGSNIPLGSRMILVADAYDAMTSERPYRERPMTRKEAIAELRRCSGTQFDPRIVNTFINTITQ